MKCKALIAINLLTVLFCNAQKSDSTVYQSYGFHGHYGFIIPHADEIEAVSNTDPAGLGINYSRFNTSIDRWKVFNSFWMSGIEAAYFNFRNSRITGSSILLTAYAEPVIAHGRKYVLSVRGGGGLSYHTRIYDTIDNPENKFFATRLSFPVYLSARLNYRLTTKALISIAANYNHISNGGIKQPNFGMNFPTLSLGLQYFPDEFPELRKGYKNDMEIKRGITIVTQILSGYRVVDETDIYPEKGALAFGLHVRASKQLSRLYALNAGGEIIFDGALKEIIKREGSSLDHKRIALTAGQDLLFGKAVFTQYFGFYVYSPYKAFRNIYQKYELSYNITGAISAGAFLKAHLYVAELMGLHLSFRL